MLSGRFNRHLVFLVNLTLISSFALSIDAFAAKKKKKEENPIKQIKKNELNSAEIVERRLRYDRSKRIPVFGRIQKLFAKKKHSAVLLEAKLLKKNKEFKDYYYFLSGKAELGRVKYFVRKKRYANAIFAGNQAIDHFNKVASANAYNSLESSAKILLGETEVYLGEVYRKKRKRKKAMNFFESGFQHLKKRRKLVLVPKKYIVSYAMLCDRRPNMVCNGWQRELTRYVDEKSKKRMMRRLSKIKFTKQKRRRSKKYKRDLDYEAFQKGFKFYLASEYGDAFGTFRNLLESYPDTNIKLRTKFWMARSAQKAGYEIKAKTIYKEIIQDIPFSYFALLASWYGKINISRMVDAEVPLALTKAPFLSAESVIHLKRAEKFIASGAPNFARYELNKIYPNAEMPNEFIVYLTLLNHIASNHLRAFQMYGELGARDYKGLISTYGQKFLFPSTHASTIYKSAKKYKIDPLLVLSIIKQESAFLHEAVSVANAYGLMQIIAPTARTLKKDISIGELFNPKTNIDLGSKYISRLLKQFDGNVILALAAYNAGPGNARRWKKAAPRGIGHEEFIELITYRETRTYVQNIMRNIYWYTRRMKKKEFKDLRHLITSFKLPNQYSAANITKR